MKRLVFLSFFVLLTLPACSAEQLQKSHQRLMVSSDEIELYEESVDTSCAYFYFLWGKTAETEDRNEEALEAYEKALVCDPQASQIMRRLVVLLVKMGDKERALGLMEKILADNPDDLNALSAVANLYVAMGKIDRAIETYKIIQQKDPENNHTRLLLGTLYAKEKDFDKAEKSFLELVEKDDKSYMGFYYLARLYREQNLFDKALSMYRKAMDINWSSSLAFEAGSMFEIQEQYDKAVEIYRLVLKEDASNEKARGHIIAIYLKTGKLDEALKELEEMRAFSSDVRNVDISTGRILIDVKRFDEAIEIFTRMLEENPDDDAIKPLLAAAYYHKDDKEAAKRLLEDIDPRFEGYEDTVLMLVRILQEQEKNEEAAEVLASRIADEKTRKKDFYRALAQIYVQLGKSEKGRETFESALQFYPADTKILFEYGMFLDQIKETTAAIEKMEMILVNEPQNPYALNYIGYTWADQGVRLTEALEYVEQAVALKPDDGYIRDSLGWVYFKQGEFEKAVAELEKALEMEPDDPTINEHMGDAYHKTGKIEKAITAYEKSEGLYKEEEKKVKVRTKLNSLKE